MNIEKKKLATGAFAVAAAALAISTVVFAAGSGGMGGGTGGGPGGGAGNMGQVELSESIIRVKLTTPTSGDLTRSTEFIGKVEPAESVSVYPETSGKVTQVYFEAGQTVQKGDLLFELDDSDAQLSYKSAQAAYEQKVISADTTLGSNYESSLLSAQSSLDSAQQNLNNARLKLKDYNEGEDDELLRAQKNEESAYQKLKTAEAELESFTGDHSSDEYKALYQTMSDANSDYSLARSTVTDLENDTDSTLRDLRASYQNAQTSYDAALAKFNLANGDSYEDTKAATDATLNAASISLEQSAATLDKYKVYAPISGVIESRSVNAYETASMQTAAFTISNKETMTVNFNASADAATALSIGDSVTVSKSGNDYTATIIEINSKADDSTGLFPIKARLETGSDVLLTGVAVKVTAATQKVENAMLIPIDNVYYEDDQAYVFTYSDGKAHRADITTGMSNSETVAVESGLTADNQIITTWHPDLKDGATVVLADAADAATTSESAAEAPAAPDSGSAPQGAAPDQAAPAGAKKQEG